MYTDPNFRSKAALRRALADGTFVSAFQPGPFGPNVTDGRHAAEGPHSPEPHRWYATVLVKDGQVVRVVS